VRHYIVEIDSIAVESDMDCDLIRRGEKPIQLTAADMAFLRALYSMDLRENLSLETSDIQNAMMREFKSH
jgi:hypothetical protein